MRDGDEPPPPQDDPRSVADPGSSADPLTFSSSSGSGTLDSRGSVASVADSVFDLPQNKVSFDAGPGVLPEIPVPMTDARQMQEEMTVAVVELTESPQHARQHSTITMEYMYGFEEDLRVIPFNDSYDRYVDTPECAILALWRRILHIC